MPKSTVTSQLQRHRNKSKKKKTIPAPTTRMTLSHVFVPSLPTHLRRADYHRCKLSLRGFSDSPPPSSSSSSTSSSSSSHSSSSSSSSPSTPICSPDLSSSSVTESLVNALNRAWEDNLSNPYPTQPQLECLLRTGHTPPPALPPLNTSDTHTSLADTFNIAWAINHLNPYPPKEEIKRFLLCRRPPPSPTPPPPQPPVLDTTDGTTGMQLADSLNQAWAVNHSDPYPGPSFSELRRRSDMERKGRSKSKSRKEQIIEWRKGRNPRRAS